MLLAHPFVLGLPLSRTSSPSLVLDADREWLQNELEAGAYDLLPGDSWQQNSLEVAGQPCTMASEPEPVAAAALPASTADPEVSSVAIVGCAKDVERMIAPVLGRMHEVARLFGSARIIVYENDSGDSTLRLLREWSEHHADVEVLSESNVSCAHQTTCLAHCRNRLLEAVSRRPPTYLLSLDMDTANLALSPGAVRTCFRLQQPWAMCGASQADSPYYDMWALRCGTVTAVTTCGLSGVGL